jgi:hypothetical protein
VTEAEPEQKWSGRFKVTYSDGREDVVRPIPAARRRLEADTGKTLAQNMSSGFSDWADFLVHETLRIRQNETRPIEQWLESVDVLGMEFVLPDAEDVPDPTGGEATPKPDGSPSPHSEPDSPSTD